MPEEPKIDWQAYSDYIDMICTVRFLEKFEKIWSDQLLLSADAADKETGYFGVEVLKQVRLTISTALENAHTQAEFDNLMKENFGDSTQE